MLMLVRIFANPHRPEEDEQCRTRQSGGTFGSSYCAAILCLERRDVCAVDMVSRIKALQDSVGDGNRLWGDRLRCKRYILRIRLVLWGR
jgi:hypothetical protein